MCRHWAESLSVLSSDSAMGRKAASKKMAAKAATNAGNEEKQPSNMDFQGRDVILKAIAYLRRKNLWECDARNKVGKGSRFPENWTGSQVDKARSGSVL